MIEEMTASKPQSNPLVLLEDARLLVQSMRIQKISHTYREDNRRADCVTKLVRELDLNVLLQNKFPFPLYRITQADALGIYYERL